ESRPRNVRATEVRTENATTSPTTRSGWCSANASMQCQSYPTTPPGHNGAKSARRPSRPCPGDIVASTSRATYLRPHERSPTRLAPSAIARMLSGRLARVQRKRDVDPAGAEDHVQPEHGCRARPGWLGATQSRAAERGRRGRGAGESSASCVRSISSDSPRLNDGLTRPAHDRVDAAHHEVRLDGSLTKHHIAPRVLATAPTFALVAGRSATRSPLRDEGRAPHAEVSEP